MKPQLVELFCAPRIAPERKCVIEANVAAELDRLPPPTVMAFIEAVVEQRELEEAFARFRRTWWRRLGIQPLRKRS